PEAAARQRDRLDPFAHPALLPHALAGARAGMMPQSMPNAFATMQTMFADWLTSAGLAGVKPVLAALLMPPVPFLVVALAGACVTRSRPRTARALVVLACVATWLCACSGFARWL